MFPVKMDAAPHGIALNAERLLYWPDLLTSLPGIKGQASQGGPVSQEQALAADTTR